MRKILLPVLVTAMLAGGAAAEVRVSVMPLADRQAASPKKVVSQADILVRQDFSDLTEDYISVPISSTDIPQDNPNTRIDNPSTDDIPASLMDGQEGWKGSFVFSGGETCVIQTHGAGAQNMSFLQTPANEYSGSLKISFIARALPTYWYTYDDNGQEERLSYTGSSLLVGIFDPEDRPIEIEGGYPNSLADVRLYADQGWCEVTVEVDNLSAYNGDYFRFQTGEIVEIDDIKITSSVDKFIAAPVLESVTDVTETSFTINLEPVRKAFNYYVYLYTLKGYDDYGQPILEPVPTQLMKDLCEIYDIPFDEYWAEYLAEWDINEPYEYFGMIDDGTSYTFTDLDPEKEYCFGFRSHYLTTFSDLVVYQQTILPTPVVEQPSAIEDDSFTARWAPVTKADFYSVSLYGVETASKGNEDYLLMEEDFSKASGNFDDPEELTPAESTDMNDFADMPGWTIMYGVPLVGDGMIGVRGWGGAVVSPELYLKGSDTVTVSARVESNNRYASAFYLSCGGDYEVCQLEDGVWTGEVTFSTRGAEWGYVQFIDLDEVDLLIDDVMVFRSVQTGDELYVFQQSQNVEGAASCVFSNLDTTAFSTFAYNILAFRYDGDEVYSSARSGMQSVVSSEMSDTTSISDLDVQGNTEIEGIYSPSGQKLADYVKGINIVRYKDGSSRKIIVK